MPRDRDADSASSGGQSKRPALNHQESDAKSDSQSDTSGLQQQHQRRHHVHHQKHHVRGLHHARAPAAKTTQKTPKLGRRHTSDPDEILQRTSAPGSASGSASQSHRRTASDVKLSSRDSSSANLNKSPSHTKIKRNRSHVEIGKRNKSTDKLKRASSHTVVSSLNKGGKNQVHFDLGVENGDDEWIDASGSNSPYLSRKGSINSGQSSLRPSAGVSASGSRPVTPTAADPVPPQDPDMPTPERQRVHHREYLTTRLLQRTPSQGVPPKMTADLAQAAAPRQYSPDSAEDRDSTTLLGSNRDELTSRFVEAPGSGLTSEGSFYRPPRGEFHLDQGLRKPRSVISLPPAREDSTSTIGEVDDSALVPKQPRRTADRPAESRTQQKLNLQRASSVVEPGQAVGGVGGVVGASPLIGVGGPGYDGGNSRDPRVGKLLERTGMEYLVVRRYQNPVARSLNRLNRIPGIDKTRRIPQLPGASTNGKQPPGLAMRHSRNVSMPDTRRPVTPKRPTSVRANGAASSFDGNDDDGRLTERLSGSSLVGGEEEDGTAAVLRNLWEKSMELSAST